MNEQVIKFEVKNDIDYLDLVKMFKLIKDGYEPYAQYKRASDPLQIEHWLEFKKGLHTNDNIQQDCSPSYAIIDGKITKGKSINDLEKELKVTEALLADRQRLLDAIPECKTHGKCVPHALDWIKEAKRIMEYYNDRT